MSEKLLLDNTDHLRMRWMLSKNQRRHRTHPVSVNTLKPPDRVSVKVLRLKKENEGEAN